MNAFGLSEQRFLTKGEWKAVISKDVPLVDDNFPDKKTFMDY